MAYYRPRVSHVFISVDHVVDHVVAIGAAPNCSCMVGHNRFVLSGFSVGYSRLYEMIHTVKPHNYVALILSLFS